MIEALAFSQTFCLVLMSILYGLDGDLQRATLSALYAICNGVVFLWK